MIYDGLVPEDGVATFQRTVELPAAWAGRAVFLRCDGAYGRAEVVVNGALAGRARQRGDVVRRRADAVPPPRRQRPRDHADRVHAVRRARRHELVRPHVAARDLARRPPVLRAAAPPRPARPRDRLGPGGRTRDRSSSGWTRSTSDLEARRFGSRRRSATRPARSPGAGPRTGRSTRSGSDRGRLETGPLDVRPWSAEEPVLYDLEVVIVGGRGRAAGVPAADRVPAGRGARQPAPRQRRADPRPRRQPPRLADPQGPRAVARTTCARTSSTFGARTSP